MKASLRVLAIILMTIIQSSVFAQGQPRDDSFQKVAASIKSKRHNIDTHIKAVQRSLSKRNRHEAKNINKFLADYFFLNQLAPLNEIAKPKESYPLVQTGRLSRGQLKRIERFEYQLTRVKDDWYNYARNGGELESYFDEITSDSLLVEEVKKQLNILISDEVLSGVLPLKFSAQNIYKEYIESIEALVDPVAGYEQFISNAFNYSDKDFERLANNELPVPFKEHEGLLSEGHERLLQLKERYGALDANVKNGISKSSLHKETFVQRLSFGGAFRFSPVKKGLKVDLSPLASYKLNTNWTLGLGGNFRLNFGENHLADSPTEVDGFRAYVKRNVLKQTFFHLEWEYLSSFQGKKAELTNPVRQNSSGFLIGLGRSIQISENFGLQTYWLYRLGNVKSSAYNSPWVFRFGFDINNK